MTHDSSGVIIFAAGRISETITGNLAAIFCLAGVGVFIAWQIRRPLLSSLEHCPVRRNRLPLFFPFLQVFVWLVAVALLNEILKRVLSTQPKIIVQFAQNMAVMTLEIMMAVFFVLVARFAFVRGLKGFGLRLDTVGKDLFWAVLNLIATYPVILLLLWLTIQAGKLFSGPEFDLQRHQTLLELNQDCPLWMKVLLVFFVLVIVPVFEELLFRGLLQSALTAYFQRPWLSIGFTSIMFASMHYGTHFFGIFALSCCLGYAYEKSGSLLRPVCIHIFFNSVSVFAVLISGVI